MNAAPRGTKPALVGQCALMPEELDKRLSLRVSADDERAIQAVSARFPAFKESLVIRQALRAGLAALLADPALISAPPPAVDAPPPAPATKPRRTRRQ